MRNPLSRLASFVFGLLLLLATQQNATNLLRCPVHGHMAAAAATGAQHHEHGDRAAEAPAHEHQGASHGCCCLGACCAGITLALPPAAAAAPGALTWFTASGPLAPATRPARRSARLLPFATPPPAIA